jgi:glucose-6-phosphate 1-epimerase
MAKDPLKELNDRFALGDQLRFELDEHGMERAVIKTPQAEAIIYLNGAHITHFQPAGQQPLLFLSSKSNFTPGKAIRGGIPIIYPWFGHKKDDPNAPMHGFARTSRWRVDLTKQIDDFVELRLTLESPKHSNLRFLTQVGPRLNIELQVSSASATPLTFEEAFHSYFAVSDVRNVFIQGLTGTAFIDKTDQMLRKTDEDQVLRLEGETDRVYINTESTCRIFDIPAKRCIKILKINSATTVVWNPWMDKAKKMPDMGDDEWRQMLCIETANTADNAITLQPGGTYRMSASINAESFDPVAILASLPHPQGIQRRRAG